MRQDTSCEELRLEKFINRIQQIHLHVHETLKKSREKYNEMHDQHRVEKTFKVGDRVWLHLTKERLQGLGNNVKEL